jgi:hypothetical protein
MLRRLQNIELSQFRPLLAAIAIRSTLFSFSAVRVCTEAVLNIKHNIFLFKYVETFLDAIPWPL